MKMIRKIKLIIIVIVTIYLCFVITSCYQVEPAKKTTEEQNFLKISGKIAFVLRHDENSEIYIMNANGSELKKLTNNPADDHSPVWSPDGKKIAFKSSYAEGEANIYIMNADGSRLTKPTDYIIDTTTLCWQP